MNLGNPLNSVQSFLDKKVPNKKLHKLIWFVFLWFVGVLGTAVLAYSIRFIMGIG